MAEWTPKSGTPITTDEWLPSSGKPTESIVTPQAKPPKKDIYSLWGAEITPKMKETHPYLSATAKTLQEGLGTPLLHFLNMEALNLPRAAAQQAGYAYPESETLPGQILSKGAGIAGAILSPVWETLGAWNLLKAKPLLTGTLGKVTPKGIGTQVLERALKPMATGALGGALYTPTEDIVGLKQRGAQALLGGVLAPIASGIAGEAGKIGRQWKQWRISFGQEKPNQRLIDDAIGFVKEKQKITRETLKTGLGRVKTREAELTQEMQRRVIESQQHTQAMIDDASLAIKSNNEKLTKQLDFDAKNATNTYKDLTPNFYKAQSDAYGIKLTSIEDGLVNSGEQMTRGEADSIFINTLADLSDSFIPEGRASQLVKSLHNKYGIKEFDMGDGITDVNKSINFSEFVTDVRQLGQTISKEAKTGKYGETDLAYALFKKNLGDWVSKGVPEFQSLQDAYSPVIQGMKLWNKIIKPKEFWSTAEGMNMIKRIAKQTPRGSEEELLLAIESGEFPAWATEGIGDVLNQYGIRRTGQQILDNPHILESYKAKVTNRHEQFRVKTEENLMSELMRGQEVGKKIGQKAEERLLGLESRAEKLQQILGNKAKVGSLLKIMAYGSAGVLGTYQIANMIRAVGAGRQQIETQ